MTSYKKKYSDIFNQVKEIDFYTSGNIIQN